MFQPIYQCNAETTDENWNNLSANPNAIHILEQNVDKIDWDMLTLNPNAIHLFFKFNYSKMTTNNNLFHKELVEYVFHPKRLFRFCNMYNLELSEFIDLL